MNSWRLSQVGYVNPIVLATNPPTTTWAPSGIFAGEDGGMRRAEGVPRGSVAGGAGCGVRWAGVQMDPEKSNVRCFWVFI